jgi:uncharacterized protein YciI
MVFIFYLIDKPNALGQRLALRPLHKEYLAKMADKIAFAGPLKSDDDKDMVGSLLAIDFPDRESANEWIRNEPFTKAGIYSTVSVYPFENLWPQKVGFPPN